MQISLSSLRKTKTFCLIHSKEINHTIGSSSNKRVLNTLNKVDLVELEIDDLLGREKVEPNKDLMQKNIS